MTERTTLRLGGIHRILIGAITIALVPFATACDNSTSDASPATSTVGTVVTTTTTPSAFCDAISGLAALQNEPTTDDAARAEHIASVYESLLNDVPDGVRSDFEFVISQLRGETPLDTVPSSADAGGVNAGESGESLVDNTPGERVNNYINFVCTKVVNNPGPAATDPP